jgi:hypothetical protein
MAQIKSHIWPAGRMLCMPVLDAGYCQVSDVDLHQISLRMHQTQKNVAHFKMGHQ